MCTSCISSQTCTELGQRKEHPLLLPAYLLARPGIFPPCSADTAPQTPELEPNAIPGVHLFLHSSAPPIRKFFHLEGWALSLTSITLKERSSLIPPCPRYWLCHGAGQLQFCPAERQWHSGLDLGLQCPALPVQITATLSPPHLKEEHCETSVRQ